MFGIPLLRPGVVVALWLSVVLIVVATAHAGVEDQTMFTVAGGGTHAPAEGVLATDARLSICALTTLPDGSIVFVQGRSGDQRLFRIDADGRLHRLPLPRVIVSGPFGPDSPTRPADVDDLDARADGTLVLALDDRVWELTPGAGRWSPLPAFAGGKVSGISISRLATVADGTLVGGGDRVWRLDADGRPSSIFRLPATVETLGDLVALPDGTFAFAAADEKDDVALFRWAPPDRFRKQQLLIDAGRPALAALSDGSILDAEFAISRYPRGRRGRILAGFTPGLGPGDGGPLNRALVDAELVAVRNGSSLVTGEKQMIDPRGPIDLLTDPGSGSLISSSDGSPDSPNLIRVTGWSTGQPPAVAITPRTFSRFSRGRVAYHTSFAGIAALNVRRGTRLVARVSAPVGAGDGELQLPGRLGEGNYLLELRVADGVRAGVNRLQVALAPLLRRARAVRLARHLADFDGGALVYYHATGCRRIMAKRFSCAEVEEYAPYDGPTKVTCPRVIDVVLRPDGARAHAVVDPRRCRQLNRPSAR